jgi:hypothetical protein
MMASLLLPLPSIVNDLPDAECDNKNTEQQSGGAGETNQKMKWSARRASRRTAVAVAKRDERDVDTVDDLQQLRHNQPLVHEHIVRQPQCVQRAHVP